MAAAEKNDADDPDTALLHLCCWPTPLTTVPHQLQLPISKLCPKQEQEQLSQQQGHPCEVYQAMDEIMMAYWGETATISVDAA
jgi:hypothetical protein